MSSESDTKFKQHAYRRAAHYRIKGAAREKVLPPKEDSPKEENQPSKENKNNVLKINSSFSSLLQSKNPEHLASSPANSLPEAASQNSISGGNLASVNAQIEVNDEAAAQASGTVELSSDVCGLE
ncbi:uncharacterized protein LOC125035858 [Penaeus chinensis]|uniref:uncharacterized protein LOC125035858 n=1 Tax=Penaeus chinensis TaxID=139456 RepID=UPI001FB7814F|nr:uncharacterized protein LOC125035858 [Penaeus chinensis]